MRAEFQHCLLLINLSLQHDYPNLTRNAKHDLLMSGKEWLGTIVHHQNVGTNLYTKAE